VAVLCKTLGVSTSGFYAWLIRPPSAHRRRDEELATKIKAIHLASRETYGVPRVHFELREVHSERVGGKRVARLMRQNGLEGASRRKKYHTTKRNKDARPAPDLVEREFTADAPNKLWIADITYIPTWSGFLYLSVVVDVWSRRVIGWAMASHLRTSLILDAFDMAVQTRAPLDVIHHSDQGTQYTSIAFGARCREVGVRPSMGSVGDCYDNAMCESFFATLECELLDKRRFRNQAEAKMAVFDFIEGWYNPRRRHSSLDYMSPAEYERRNWLAA
jgi:putative transposase